MGKRKKDLINIIRCKDCLHYYIPMTIKRYKYGYCSKQSKYKNNDMQYKMHTTTNEFIRVGENFGCILFNNKNDNTF